MVHRQDLLCILNSVFGLTVDKCMVESTKYVLVCFALEMFDNNVIIYNLKEIL